MSGYPINPPSGSVRAGFFGKIPSRGDFVRSGLSSAFVQAWDNWALQVLPATRQILGENWESAWREAVPWRFALRAGQCGPHSVIGLWLPSADRVGRPWPLVIAAEGGATEGAGSEGFLDEAEHIGRSAVRSAMSPEDFAAALDAVPLPGPAGATAAWWRTMSGDKIRIAAQDGLPDAACFALMLQP